MWRVRNVRFYPLAGQASSCNSRRLRPGTLGMAARLLSAGRALPVGPPSPTSSTTQSTTHPAAHNYPYTNSFVRGSISNQRAGSITSHSPLGSWARPFNEFQGGPLFCVGLGGKRDPARHLRSHLFETHIPPMRTGAHLRRLLCAWPMRLTRRAGGFGSWRLMDSWCTLSSITVSPAIVREWPIIYRGISLTFSEQDDRSHSPNIKGKDHKGGDRDPFPEPPAVGEGRPHKK